MSAIRELEQKREYVLPPHPKAHGKVTAYIEGYPTEDDEPMSATEFHGRQISTLSTMLISFFGVDQQVYVGTDSFIYYQEGDISKSVAPDVYVVRGVDSIPARRSFYTWAEGAVPIVAFEFLSESTKKRDREDKPKLYLQEIGMKEYFIHQPSPDYPFEFRGWRRTEDGKIIEIEPDKRGWLFSETLNLWFLVEDQIDKVRLMRPYQPNGEPIPTRQELIDQSTTEADARRQAVAKAQLETEARQQAEARARAEAQARIELEAEIERLRVLLAERSE